MPVRSPVTYVLPLVALLHSLLVMTPWLTGFTRTLVLDLLYLLVIAVTALLVLLEVRPERVLTNRFARAVLPLLLAEAWMLQYDFPGRELPDWSVADPLYFAFYLGVAFTLAYLHGLTRWSWRTWGWVLDSLIVVAVVGEAAWFSSLRSALAGSESWVLRGINLAYVLCDLLLLGMALLSLRQQFARPLLLFVLGVLGFVGADLLYLGLGDRYVPGTPMDLLWTWGTVAQALGLLGASREIFAPTSAPRSSPLPERWRVVAFLPYVAVGVTCLLLVQYAGGGQGQSAAWWTVGILVLVMVRQAVTFTERSLLTRRLREQTRQLQHMALHDGLTGLGNRAAFDQHLQEQLAQTAISVTLYYFDLDSLKAINDSLGHEAGDETLREVARRLRGVLPPGAFAARMGGDEFAVIVPGFDSVPAAQALLLRFLAAMQLPVSLLDKPVQVRVSVGMAFRAAGEEVDAAKFRHQADQEMYRWKQKYRSISLEAASGLNSSAQN